MSCENIPSIADLEKTKIRVDHFGEVIDGTSSGTSQNPITGLVLTDLPTTLKNVGFKPASFTFVTGGTLTANDYDKAVYNPAPNGDNNWYSWGGALPKTIPANSTPQSTGGFSKTAWIQRTDETLMSMIVDAAGTSDIDTALYDITSAAYAIRNKRLLGVANNLLRSGSPVKIVCLGDSMTYGYDVNSPDKLPPVPPHIREQAPIQYPSRLQDRLNALTNSNVTVVNYGYSGDTAKGGYNRWTANPACHVVHIMFGINDASAGVFSEYCEYMEKLIRKYIDWGHGVVIHTATAQQYNNTNSGGTRYSQYARTIAEQYGCPVFESEGVLQYCRYNSIHSDGTHFNKAGYAKYGDAVASFILAGCWVRPVRNIASYTRQQAGRSTEGIGWYGVDGAYTTFNEGDAYVWNGQTGGINANSEGIHSFSFFLDADAANVYFVGQLDGATISLADPVTTVEGNEAVNRSPHKTAHLSIAETKPYTISNRQQAYKQWAGALIGRGWKTVYVKQVATNASVAYVSDLIIGPCTPEMTVQANNNVMPAIRETMVFNCPIQPIDLWNAPAPVKLPAKIYFPLPKGLYRQSQIWTNYYDNLVLDISILTKTSDGGSTYNGVHKMTTYTSTPGLGAGTVTPETMYKSNVNCATPSSIKFGYEDPNSPGTIIENAYPPMPAARMYLILNFPDAPAAYFSVEVACSAILDGQGTYMY